MGYELIYIGSMDGRNEILERYSWNAGVTTVDWDMGGKTIFIFIVLAPNLMWVEE